MNHLDQKTIETIRLLAVDAVNKSNSGHPGLPMGTATMAFALWKEFLRGTKEDPKWIARDRFILSAGHGSMLQYALLHLFGYQMSMEDIKSFRQFGSNTPGHPEYGMTEGVEMTTGPLGQGIASAVGFAIAQEKMAADFNGDTNLFDHYTYVIAGDGDLMEGISSEASSMAGHLGLGKMIVLYDDNEITIDGRTDISFTEDVVKRYEAYGWQVLVVEDGNDYEAIVEAIKAGQEETQKPTLIKVRNIIGFGSPNKSDKSAAHGAPLGPEEARLTKEVFGWDPDKEFYVPTEVYEYMEEIIRNKSAEKAAWDKDFAAYQKAHKPLADKLETFLAGEVTIDPQDFYEALAGTDASRGYGGKMLNALAPLVENLIGGSADLASSNKSYLKGMGDFQKNQYDGRNLHFGIREHAMAAIMNGIALHGGYIPYGATFLSFADYMKPSIRLAALMGQRVIYIFTHDSIGVGEDGPTHQPIEHLLMLRSIPGLKVFRPADGLETVHAFEHALGYQGPSAMILTRQNLTALPEERQDLDKGAYIIRKEQKEATDVIIMATGSEVGLGLGAADELAKEGIEARVVSVVSLEVFEEQDEAYREMVLPKEHHKRVSIEMASTLGWYKYLGFDGLAIGLDRFGESAPAEVLFDHFGFTVPKVTEKIKAYLG